MKANALLSRLGKRLLVRAGILLLVAVWISLSVWSWRKWPDILVDFGRELYVPWQLASGKVLYTDIAHLSGPLSQYFNALTFSLFGVSYFTLIVVNFLNIGALTFLLYRLFKLATDEITAVVTSLVFLCVFAFSQYAEVGNYNYMSPYAHESAHGVILSVAMIYCLCVFVRKSRNSYLVVAGLLVGLVFLTKVEIFVAALGTMLCFFLLLRWSPVHDAKILKSGPWVTAVAACVPPLVFGLYFSSKMPLPEAVKATCGAWTTFLTSSISSTHFYKVLLGTDNIPNSLWQILKYTIFLTTGIFLLTATCKGWKGGKPTSPLAWTLSISAVALLAGSPWYLWIRLGRAFPVLTLLIAVVLAAVFFKRRLQDEELSVQLIPMLLWSAFAGLMMMKVILNVKIYHYGFYIAMPSMLLLVSFLLWHVPKWLEANNCPGALFRFAVLLLIAVSLHSFLDRSSFFYSKKELRVGSSGDAMITYPQSMNGRGIGVSHVVKWSNEFMNDDATFIVLPEGVIMNYLARRENPTRHINFMVPEMLVTGEETMLKDIQRHAPDYVVIFHRETDEYGVGYFGSDPRYGKKIMDWIHEAYTPAITIGSKPLKDDKFGIKIMRKRDHSKKS